MLKKLITLFCLIISILTLSSCDVGVKRASLEDFEYERTSSGLLLTKYIGEKTKFKVKSTYDSIYVAGITKDTFSFNENIEEIVLDDVNIPRYAFEGCTNLKSVKLRNIGTVDDYAFKGCVNLEEIELEGTLSYLSSLAFLDCHKLTKTNMFGGSFSSYNADKKKEIYAYNGNTLVLGTDGIHGDSVTDIYAIGDYAFYGRDALSSLIIPHTVTRIGKYVVGNCQNLTRISVDKSNSVYDSRNYCNAVIESNTDKLVLGCKNTIIPDDTKIIGEYAFADCKSLKGINIPSSVKTIEANAFVGCQALETIYVNENNLAYDTRDNANAIIETATNKLILACNNTVIPSSVEVIGSNAFSNTSLTSIVIPEGVKTIEANAFKNMTSLTSISLPSTLETIEANAFMGCDNLEQIIVHPENLKYDSRNNCNAIIEKATDKLVVSCKGTVIPNNVSVIGSNAFANSKTLQTITIPSSVKLIEANAFANCSNLVTVNFSEGLEEIADNAFANCSSIINLLFPTTLKVIGENAFLNLKLVETLRISKNLTSIKTKAFSGCESLINIVVENENPIYCSIANSSLVEKETSALVLGCATTIIDSQITTIKAYAFSGSKLKYVEIPANVTNIEPAAFANCVYLNQIEVADANPVYEDRGLNAILLKGGDSILAGCNATTIDKSIKSIGAHAFEGCGLRNFTLPKNVNKIEEYAFANSKLLTHIKISTKIEVIEAHAFANCDELYIMFDYFWSFDAPEGFSKDWNSSNCRTNI